MAKANKKVVPAYKVDFTPVVKTTHIKECVVCGGKINKDRLEALKSLGLPQTKWTCVEHSTVKKVLGQYLGEHGTSKMLIVDKIEEVSVRSMFKKSTDDHSSDED